MRQKEDPRCKGAHVMIQTVCMGSYLIHVARLGDATTPCRLAEGICSIWKERGGDIQFRSHPCVACTCEEGDC